jgi:hypothetical protein
MHWSTPGICKENSVYSMKMGSKTKTKFVVKEFSATHTHKNTHTYKEMKKKKDRPSILF